MKFGTELMFAFEARKMAGSSDPFAEAFKLVNGVDYYPWRASYRAARKVAAKEAYMVHSRRAEAQRAV